MSTNYHPNRPNRPPRYWSLILYAAMLRTCVGIASSAFNLAEPRLHQAGFDINIPWMIRIRALAHLVRKLRWFRRPRVGSSSPIMFR